MISGAGKYCWNNETISKLKECVTKILDEHCICSKMSRKLRAVESVQNLPTLTRSYGSTPT